MINSVHQFSDCVLSRLFSVCSTLKQMGRLVVWNIFLIFCATILIPCLIQSSALAAAEAFSDSKVKAVRLCDVGGNGVCVEGCFHANGVVDGMTIQQEQQAQPFFGSIDNLKSNGAICSNSTENSTENGTKESRQEAVNHEDIATKITGTIIGAILGAGLGLCVAWLIIIGFGRYI